MASMRRFLQFILLSGYMLGPWAVAQGQARTISIDVVATVAVTSCIRDGDSTLVVSVINMEALESPSLEEYEVHEAEHRRQFAADPSLCVELMQLNTLLAEKSPKLPEAWGRWAPKLLRLEVGAYCASALVPIRQGALPSAVYLENQEMLIEQFRGLFPPGIVIAALFKGCGNLLTEGGPNGEGK